MTSKRRPALDTYMEWVQRFPLKTIKNDAEHARAASIISDLIGRPLDSGTGDYLDALIVLVNNYEDEQHSMPDNMTPQAAVRALMDANGLTQADIGRIVGSESAVSMFLRGTRELSKSQIKKLAARFRVDASVLMGCGIALMDNQGDAAPRSFEPHSGPIPLTLPVRS